MKKQIFKHIVKSSAFAGAFSVSSSLMAGYCGLCNCDYEGEYCQNEQHPALIQQKAEHLWDDLIQETEKQISLLQEKLAALQTIKEAKKEIISDKSWSCSVSSFIRCIEPSKGNVRKSFYAIENKTMWVGYVNENQLDLIQHLVKQPFIDFNPYLSFQEATNAFYNKNAEYGPLSIIRITLPGANLLRFERF